MKYQILVILLVATAIVKAQKTDYEVFLENGQPILLGKITKPRLQQQPYVDWYQKSYKSYVVDTALVNLFGKSLKKHQIKLFLGTWCGDSKREVPRILKILEQADFQWENLELIALDRRKGNYKKSPGGEEKGWEIKKVPTLIFLKDGKEINRIVENPVESLEEDIFAILNGQSYVPNYSLK